MAKREESIVTAVDAVIALYGPLLAGWMEERPDFHGISTVIGQDNASAWPSDCDGMGYGDGEFEAAAREEMQAREDDLAAIAAACPVLRRTERPLSVWATRSKGGNVIVGAVAGTGLGEAFVRRMATKVKGKDLLITDDAEFHCVFKPAGGQDRARLIELARADLGSAFHQAVADGTLLNVSFSKSRRRLVEWMLAAEIRSESEVDKGTEGILTAATLCRQDPLKIFVPEDKVDAATKVGKDVAVQAFRSPVSRSSVSPAPRLPLRSASAASS